MKKKHEELRVKKEQEEEKRLQRVPVAAPQRFDAIKYQQQMLERARKIDALRKHGELQAMQQAQECTFQPEINTSYQMRHEKPSVAMSAVDRYTSIESSRRLRLAELLQQQEEDLKRECTFKPQIIAHPSLQQRGEFLAEMQLQERKKRLQQLLTTGDERDALRSLRSAISASPGGRTSPSPAHPKPAAAAALQFSPGLQFSPALSRAASIVGADGGGGAVPVLRLMVDMKTLI